MRRGSVWPVSGISRRELRVAVAFAATVAFAFAADGIYAGGGDRTISIYNIHTKETLTATFKRDGKYDQAALKRINHVMRDWRIDEEIEVDPKLADLLWELHTELGAKKPIHLISGYRSGQTNDMLRRTRGGQAKKSLHIQGLAADVYFPDVPLERLRNAALVRQRGGVGYYPRSGQPFVHIDTGRVRHWPSIPETELASIMNGKTYRPEPRTLPEPTQLASAVFDKAVAPPRAKPESAEPAVALDTEARPIRFAAVDEVVVEPSRSVSAASDSHTGNGRDWGQSRLLPSAPRAVAPSNNWIAAGYGPSRVIVTAAATNGGSSGGSKGDAPAGLRPGVAVGYAGLPEVDHSDRVSGLLSNGTSDLARLLAEAQYIGGRPNDSTDGQPTDLRPAVMIHSRAELPTAVASLPAPVATASMSPAAEPRLASSSLSRRLRARLGGPSLTAPSSLPALGTSPEFLRGLLRTPASEHGVTFTRIASLTTDDLTFIRPAVNSVNEAPRIIEVAPREDARADVEGLAGEVVALAERAIGWFLGN